MKKLLILAAIATILFSCSQEEPLQKENALENFDSSKLRTKEEVINIAQDFANEHQRGRSGARYVDKSKVFTLDSHKSRSNSEPLMYVVEYEDNKGYAIVSAPKNVEPILAVIDEGNYQESINSGNPGFKFFMDAAEEYVSTMSIGPIDPNPDGPNDPKPLAEYRVEIDTIGHVVREPKLINRDQHYPEGALCSNSISGCFATATFMICETFEEPKTIKLSYDNNKIVNLNWTEIHKARSFNKDSKQFGPRIFPIEENENYKCIAQLCREIGNISNANYDLPDVTLTNPTIYRATLKKILPGKTIGSLQNYDYDDIVKTLVSGGLVLCNGDSEESQYGHAWVAEGCENLITTMSTYYREQGKITWKLLKTEQAQKRLVYFNWGSSGVSNGYYAGEVFKAGNYTYSKNLKMIAIK